MLWIVGFISFLIFVPIPVYFKMSLRHIQIYGFKRNFKQQNNTGESTSKRSSVPLFKSMITLFKCIRIRSIKLYLGNQTGDMDTDLLFYVCSQAIFPLFLTWLKTYKIKADIYVQKKPWEYFYFEGIITICLAKLILEILRR